ncbi:MAG: cell division protein ZapA [Lachnospiraceae bacterium]|nr:cell division protein ZapA [Lachnospiraceae bacterium]MBQ9391264.1 cell division protein ZapA [Lachnospiraceae bacterium]
MSAKKNTEVLIGGKKYTISGYEEEEYLQRVASYINSKLKEFNEIDSFRRLSADMKSILTEVNIADDYFKAKEQIEKLESDCETKDQDIFKFKHDLINLQVENEELKKRIESLDEEKKELLLAKTKLEASLEESLLGPSTSNYNS